MKITGTKKFFIILFSLACALTMGAGIVFSRSTGVTHTAYAANENRALPFAEGEKISDAVSQEDKIALAKIAQQTGIAPELISFYARSYGGTEATLYASYKDDMQALAQTLAQFAQDYSSKKLYATEDVSGEDWYVSPDEASSYAWWADAIGLQQSWGGYYSSKDGGLTWEDQYYRNANFTMGWYRKWNDTVRSTNLWQREKYDYIIYNIVWLEEGDSYTFGHTWRGTKNGYSLVSVFPETVDSNTFLSSDTFLGGVNGGLFDTSGRVNIDPDTSRNNQAAYLDEFGSTIAPNSSSYTTSLGTGAGSAERMTIKPDAPSGAYFIVNQSSGSYQGGNQFTSPGGGGGNLPFKYNGEPSGPGGHERYSPFCSYVTLVCRRGITKPKLEFNNGVNVTLTDKKVAYNGQEHEMIIEGDWGSGLETYVISEWDDVNQAWKDFPANASSDNVKQKSRGVRGSITKAGKLVFGATNTGKYKVTMTPFRNWGRDENDRTPVTFTFEIKPSEVEIPSLIQEPGVDLATQTKFVYETGNQLYVSVYPVPGDWVSYTTTYLTTAATKPATPLKLFSYSGNGVLTMAQDTQGKYTISVELKGNTPQKTNVTWSDGTILPKVFTFEIGPRKVVVPDIIKDAGKITTFTKEVTYNGATQYLSFMPVDDNQITKNAINTVTGEDCASQISYADKTLIFKALDAGRYELTISVKTEYIFDDPNLSTSLTYILIINELEITAPVLAEPTAVNNVKTITFGGEKMPGGQEDWVGTLSFTNCDESRINWKSNSLSQKEWSDSKLVLSGRSAKTYDVTFLPKKNYVWKGGVTVPTYSLVIEKLKIAEPVLFKDNEEGARYPTPTSKSILFDGSVHSLVLYLQPLDELKNIIYTKSASVDVKYNGTFDRKWEGDYVTYKNHLAGEYTFSISPMKDYCWQDGSSDAKLFNFIIEPIDIESLEYYATNEFGSGLVEYSYNEDTGYTANLNYDGRPKTMRIGDAIPASDRGKYMLTGDFGKSFCFLDEAGEIIGSAAKLPDGVTCDEGDGFLTLTMTTAGVYRVGIRLNEPQFRWLENKQTIMVYTLTINPEGIAPPQIDSSSCLGYDFQNNITDTTMVGTYYNIDFAMVLTLDDVKLRDYIEIVDGKNATFKFDASRSDSAVTAARANALKEKNGIFTDWVNGKVYFYAKDHGEYSWTVKLTNPNYAWAGLGKQRDITFKLTIDRSPVSGLEMHFVGDEDEAVVNTATGILVEGATDVCGPSTNAITVKYEQTSYTEKPKEFYFVRTDVGHLVQTGFSTQFSYKFNKYVADPDYDEADINNPVELDFNELMLKMSALDAGTYEIIITPTDNYCWNFGSLKNFDSVKFTLVINKCVLQAPLVIDENGNRVTTGKKTLAYQKEYLTMQLDLNANKLNSTPTYPRGYAIKSFEYVDRDKDTRTDLMPVRTSGTGTYDSATINLGVDPDTGLLSVQAQSAGEYTLTVVVSNINNYVLAQNQPDLPYKFFIARREVKNADYDAYVLDKQLTATEAAAKTLTETDVASEVARLLFDSDRSASVTFDGKFHAAYIYGDAVSKGYLSFTVKLVGTNPTNGDAVKKVINPDELLDGSTTDKTGYFKLAVFGVNVYEISMAFVTRDYYWQGNAGTSSSSAEIRKFTLGITPKEVAVPRMDSGRNLPLINDRYTQEFGYVKGQSQMVTLEGVEFGDLVNGSYEIINGAATNATLLIVTPYPAADATGKITMQTSLDGTTAGEAQVPNSYVLKLTIDTANMRWAEGSSDAVRYYEIKIVKSRVARPYIIDTLDSTGDMKEVFYNGKPWNGNPSNDGSGNSDLLQIALMDSSVISYALSDTIKMTGSIAANAMIGVKPYNNLLSVTAPADAGTYSVVAQLSDPSNSEWADGFVGSITFSLEVRKVRVSKPQIVIPAGSTAASEGVVGRTKIRYYNDVEYFMQIANYWDDGTNVPTSVASPAPAIMSYAIVNGTFKTKQFIDNQVNPSSTSNFNKGVLNFGAVNADKYIVRFTLTGNAMWDDETTAPIDVILQINKKLHDDLFIFDDPSDSEHTISNNTQSYYFKLVGSAAVDRYMQINNYDNTLMTYTGVVNGKTFTSDGAGYLEDKVADSNDIKLGEQTIGSVSAPNAFAVKASQAGDYEIEFTLTDFANHRWKFADVATCTFTLNIKKQQLTKPTINTAHKLENEKIDNNSLTLTVDYDKRLHTILVYSYFADLNNGAYGTNGAQYFTVTDNTVAKNIAADPAYNAATHLTYFEKYDDTAASNLTIKDLLEDTTIFTSTVLPSGYTYGGADASSSAAYLNLMRLTAYTPGEYYMTFAIANTDNFEWADGTSTDIDVKLIIKKVAHNAPIVAPGSATSLQYSAKPVEFAIHNAFNGVDVKGGAVVGTVSEKYALIEYVGPDATLTASYGPGVVATPDYTSQPFLSNWFNGVLTLGFTEVGSYKIRVAITDTNFIAWSNSAQTEVDFIFNVTKRALDAEVVFSASNDAKLDAELSTVGSAKQWPITVNGGVDAMITIRGLYDLPSATTWNQRIAFKVYYESVSAAGTEINTQSFADDDSPIQWLSPVKQSDGSYSIALWYFQIENGRDANGVPKIASGKYNLCIEQVDTDGNHTFGGSPVKFAFEILPDPAPFNKDMLQWSFTRSDDPVGTAPRVITGLGDNKDNRFGQDFEEGVTYTFHAQLNAVGAAGFGTPSPAPATLKAQLNTWFVDWDNTYIGTRTSVGAGDYEVKIKITALIPGDYAFPDYEFTMYYRIEQAKYDLSGLKWDYDGSTPFEYDGTAKSVSVVGSFPVGLTINKYMTTGTYQSVPNPVATESSVNSNSKNCAGDYVTEIVFQIPNPSNYVLPVKGNPDTYTGSFEWTRAWTITPKHIEVDWFQATSVGSDGNKITQSKPIVAAPYTGMFVVDNYDKVNGAWGTTPVSAITRKPGQTLDYKAVARLKNGSGLTDYARNFTFEFIGGNDPAIGNPLEYQVGGNDTMIYNHVTVDGKTQTEYEYTGSPLTAEAVIDVDTSNGQITLANITVLYSKRDTATGEPVGSTTTTAPDQVGNYIVILKLSFSGASESYALSMPTFAYDIIKAKFKSSEFEWHIKHDDGTNKYEARYDVKMGGIWIDVATKEQVNVAYDGKAYDISLVSEKYASIITFTYDVTSKIDAGSYTTTAVATFDTARYEFDPNDPVNLTFDWEIDKCLLDLDNIEWDYEKPFVYTIVNGKPQAFAAQLKNVPEYLLDKMVYAVVRGTEPLTGDITDTGTYQSTVSIDTGLIDDANYVVGAWPAAVPTTFTWNIDLREIACPQNDMSWTVFDGMQHNLLKPFGFDVDWEQYFAVEVTYTDAENNTSAYDGSSLYGGKYYAYNAGTYSFAFKIHAKYNTNLISNIAWAISENGGTRKTTADQSLSYTIAKKGLTVTGWNQNYENSSVIIAEKVEVDKFVSYKFYTGNAGDAGTEAKLDDILESGGGDVFSMVPVLRKAYESNMTLTFNPGTQFVSFTTPFISAADADKVNGKPYIYGYSIKGQTSNFTNEQLASGNLYVTYTGEDITFKIYNWDAYYSQYVEIWGGDDLTQREAGEYSVTLVLRKDLAKPLYWGIKAGNKIDRSSITLKFSIRYKMLTVPELPADITYSGATINVLDKATNASKAQLELEYGDYVTITGNTRKDVGDQKLYLTIKDEFGTAVRWNDGTEQGLAGTYTFEWKISPILIKQPQKDPDAKTPEYDGTAHSVYEVLKGYNDGKPTPAIALLMSSVKETNGRSINAGVFAAELALPNANYAWCDAAGKMLEDRSPIRINWSINKKVIDFTNAYWGYKDGETDVAYDDTAPFVFTMENGAVKNHVVEILGMPEILKLYTSYRTGGKDGVNYGGEVGTYTTTVNFDLSKLDTDNFTIGVIPDDISQLVWRIVARELDMPEFDGSWTVFDGKIHELTALLNLPADWYEYLDITVEYKENDGGAYAPYDGGDDPVVEFSVYNGFRYGFYKLSISLKQNGSTLTSNTLKWVGGVAPDDIVITVSPYDIIVSGWFDDAEYSHVLFKDGATLPDEIAAKLDYNMYERDDINKVPVAPENIIGGITYYIEYLVKEGKDEKGIAYNYGINLKFEEGVATKYEFGSYDYGDQPIVWLPVPVLKTAVSEYNGGEQTFVIKDFATAYKLTYAARQNLKLFYKVDLPASATSYAYLQNSKDLTKTAAGEYTAVVRLLNKVRLSWYDSEIYTTDHNGRLVDKKDLNSPILDDDAVTLGLFDNRSRILKFQITPKKVTPISDEDLEKLASIVLSYDGKEKDVTLEKADVFAEFEAKYGKVFDYANKKGTAAGEYELLITLADNSSSYWDINGTEQEVTIDGYAFKYVADATSWKLKLIKVDKDGNPERDSANNYIVFNNGNYKADINYMPKFKTEFVEHSPTTTPPTASLLKADGSVDTDNPLNQLTDPNVNGALADYEYVMQADKVTVQRYSKVGNTYNVDPAGDYVQRFMLDVNAEAKYGYKVPFEENADEYTMLFSSLTINQVTSQPVAAVVNGKVIDTYLYYDGTDYSLRKFVLDPNNPGEILDVGGGNYMEDPASPIEATCIIPNSAIRYDLVGGQFVANPLGAYLLRNVLNPDGTVKQRIVYEKDTNGRPIVDAKNSVVKETVYDNTTPVEYNAKWKISNAVLARPVFDETLMKQYTGSKLFAKDVLTGFLPDLMKITEDAEGINAGVYTAKIEIIPGASSEWADTTDNYVLVQWKIDTVKVDLSNIAWEYYDGTSTYTDSTSFEYARKNGKPVIYWVQVANLPEALKAKTIYTTNGKKGAYAGTEAGLYMTTVSFDVDENFDSFTIPNTFDTAITWSIKRKVIEVPVVADDWSIYDDAAHDLLKVLNVPADWSEYYEIKVQYADNFVDYKAYEGHAGNPYEAFGAGSYKFTLSIKTGINTSITNPNVVWKLPDPDNSGGQIPPAQPDQTSQPSMASSFAAYSAEVEEDDSAEIDCAQTQIVNESVRQTVAESIRENAIKEVYNRLKELTVCEDAQIKSYRKYSC